MRTLKSIALAILLLCGAAPVSGQSAPTRNPTETAPEHEAIIRAGVELHDKGDYDAAIAKYQEVLAKNPSDVTALFEMAFSYLSKQDFDKCFEAAKKGAEFKSDLLPMFYDLMASVLDSKGQPQEAVDMYKRGIALAPDASQLYYNMAVTYRESLKQPNDARLALQQAAAIEPLYPDVQLLLGQVYQSSGYSAPAFFALSTFLVVDPGGKQALPGYGLWRAVLKGGVNANADGKVMPSAPTPNQGMRPPDSSAPRRADE